MRNIYIAGKIEDADYITDMYSAIEADGHLITLRWPELGQLAKPYMNNLDTNREAARIMIDAAATADTFILLGHSALKGALIEFGAFLGSPNSQEAYIIGAQQMPQTAFLSHPKVQLADSLNIVLENIRTSKR